MRDLQIREKMKEFMSRFQLTSKCQNLYMKRNSVLQNCYRIQLLLGFIAILCYVIIIPKHYNTYMADIDHAMKEDVEYEKHELQLVISRDIIDHEAVRKDLNYNSGSYEYRWKDDLVAYDYEFDERILNEYQKKYNFQKFLYYKGFQNKEHLKTRTRAIFGCVNSLLFVVSSILGIVAGKIGTRTHRFFALVASAAAGLFCVTFFLPVFNYVLVDYIQELKDIKMYESMIQAFQARKENLPSFKKGFEMSHVKSNIEAIISIFIIQIVIGILQAILAAMNFIILSTSVCFKDEDTTTVGRANQNRNMSELSVQTLEQALKFEQDLPPKYEEILESNETPPPKFEDVEETEEQTSNK